MKIVKTAILASVLVLASCSSSMKALSEDKRDASSVRKAVIVNNEDQEFTYANNICSGCEFVSKSIIYKDSKPYDVLKYKKPNGATVKYYFDISRFYGKNF
ncbi:hypothetical protein [Aureivirga sp. CE67]|uniref:hypothetical protein n=1 Tax=Aureivirga sp. CE67 TaxID=1788983 RepID=UPI0018C994B9|nr:hypothetical protein [Aureivirga sp. CE67]